MPRKLASALLLAALALAGLGALAEQAAQGAAAQGAPPPKPGSDTLCQLRVRVKNGGSRQVSALGFEVKLNGRPLPVYEKQLYLQTIASGAAEEVRLFNFWTTESGRPAPADGKLKVEVALKEAQWVEVKSEGGAEVWKPLGPVEGLPVTAAVTLELKQGTGGSPPG